VGLRVNGSEIPWSVLTSFVIFVFWLGGLSFQVAAQDRKIDSHEERPSHSIAAIEVSELKSSVKYNQKTIEEIKENQKEQSKKLDKILEKLSEK